MELHVSLTAAVPSAAWVEYIPQLDAVATAAWPSKMAWPWRPTRRGWASNGSHDELERRASARHTID